MKFQQGAILFALLALGSCGETPLYSPGSTNGDRNVYFGSLVPASDRFSARYAQQSDILIVVDNSGSMAQEIQAVKSNLGTFHANLNARRLNDYRLAVVTTDAYSHQGTLVTDGAGNDIVSSTAPDPVGTMKRIIENIVDSPKSYWEQGLKSIHLALEKNGSRLLRPGIDLMVIVLSDEQDYSCLDAQGLAGGRDCPGLADTNTQPETFSVPLPWTAVPVAAYESYLRSLGRGVLVFPIVGTPDRNCEEASKGTRYIELRNRLGSGFVSSICNDILPQNFNQIASSISTRGDCYPLSRSARNSPAAIVVRVDNRPLPKGDQGFSYDEGTNSICFSGTFIPTAGSAIAVDYTAPE